MDRPQVFPPINHVVGVEEVYGAKDLIDAINALAVAIANRQPTTIIIGNNNQ
jgi:hypothetical protein